MLFNSYYDIKGGRSIVILLFTEFKTPSIPLAVSLANTYADIPHSIDTVNNAETNFFIKIPYI